MKNYKVVFLQPALDDLEDIVLYIAKDSKMAALKMHDQILENANKLRTFPKLGVPIPNKKMSESGFRMLAIGKYLLFYKIYDEEINILRVLHGMRNYPKLFERQSCNNED